MQIRVCKYVRYWLQVGFPTLWKDNERYLIKNCEFLLHSVLTLHLRKEVCIDLRKPLTQSGYRQWTGQYFNNSSHIAARTGAEGPVLSSITYGWSEVPLHLTFCQQFPPLRTDITAQAGPGSRSHFIIKCPATVNLIQEPTSDRMKLFHSIFFCDARGLARVCWFMCGIRKMI